MKKHQKQILSLLRRHKTGLIRRGAEIGVWRGDTSRVLLEALPQISMLGVDNYNPNHYIKVFDGQSKEEIRRQAYDQLGQYITAGRYTLLEMDSVDAAAVQENGSFDFIFIDADHWYEGVRDDLHAWWPKIRKGGIFMGHDYDGKGDRMKRNPFGVKRAVDEFTKAFRLPLHIGRGTIWYTYKL